MRNLRQTFLKIRRKKKAFVFPSVDFIKYEQVLNIRNPFFEASPEAF